MIHRDCWLPPWEFLTPEAWSGLRIHTSTQSLDSADSTGTLLKTGVRKLRNFLACIFCFLLKIMEACVLS